ncbi:heterokaryon incompatibility domain-containing protein [Trichoderma sp. SZMC 28012]
MVGRKIFSWIKEKALGPSIDDDEPETIGDACDICHWNGENNYQESANDRLRETRRSLQLQPGQRTLELSRSARERGCLCCAILWQLMERSLLGELHDADISIQLFSAGYFTIEWRYHFNDSVTQNWMFALPDCWEEAVKVVAKKHRWMYLPLYNMQKETTLSRDTSSDKCLSWAKAQLDKCVKHHKQCADATSDFLPTRLIDVQPLGPDGDVVLRNGGDIPAGSPYVALSHCWGPNGRTEIKCRTLSGNLFSQLHRIPRSSLSQTFQDAVDFTRRLGMRFLWIDCICIIQEDKDDWQKEAPRMFDVYHNARLTLAAHHARTSLEGLYSKSTPDRETHITLPPKVANEMMKRDSGGIEKGPIEMIGLQMDPICPFRSNSEDNSELLSFEAPLKNSDRDHYDSGPLFTRAWTFQERLVSRRVLVFTANDLAWECNTMLTCECKRSDMDTSIKTDYSKTLEGATSKWYKKKQVTAREDLWWTLIEQYSRLGITNATDKLPAVAAIAQQLHMTSRQDETYYAGLWSGSLFQDMLWVSDIQDYQNRAARPKNPDPNGVKWWPSPTWSWASVQDPVKFLGSTYDIKPNVKPLAELIEIECRNSDGEAFMRPDESTCLLTLRSKTAHARLQKTLRWARHVLFTVQVGETGRGSVIAYNRKTDDDANLEGIIDTRMVFMDYDPWPQSFSILRSDSNAEADAAPDEDFSASEAADNDSEDNNFGSPVDGAEMDVELMEIADVTYKKDITIHKKDRHQAIFMILKGNGPDDDRRYERLGLVKVSYYTDENFVSAFREATLNRPNRDCILV